MERLKPTFHVEGIPFFWGGEERKKNVEEAMAFEFLPDDILVAGYPRSGTTFRKQLIWLVAHGGDVEQAKKVKQRERIIMLDRFDTESGETKPVEQLEAMRDRPRVIFTHLPYNLLQKNAEAAGCKVICLLRNPKDVAVSLFHVSSFFLPRLGEGFRDPAFGDVLGAMYGEFDRGNYFDHVISYWKHRENPRFLFMFYEEHHKNYGAIVQQVAKFLGKEIDKEQEEKIAEFFEFDKFKEFMNAEIATSTNTDEKQKAKFVRKGDVGQWKEYFTVAQNQRFDAFIKKKLQGYDVPFQYE